MTPLEKRNAVLDAAKALVLKGWCQNTYAMAEGFEVRVSSPRATCFCAAGAVMRTEGFAVERGTPALAALDAVARRFSPDCRNAIAAYNDAPGRTKYEVAALFDHAKEEPL